MNLLFSLIGLVGLILLVFPVYLAVFALAGHRYKLPSIVNQAAPTTRRYAVLIPAYKEDAVILDTVDHARSQTIGSSAYDVYVIADRLGLDTIKLLSERSVGVIPVHFKNSTKVKALREAVVALKDHGYDSVVILDADNLMAEDFLARIDAQFQAGARVVQGLRAPKNLDRPLARLDGLTESINTHIFRKGHVALGLPSALTGSGMAFEWDLFADYITNAKAVGGFDKELELLLMEQGIDIVYDDAAVVLDEKVASSDNLTRQRSRWMGAQWHYAAQHAAQATSYLFQGKKAAYVDKAFQMVMPPRVLMLAAYLILTPACAALLPVWSSLPWILGLAFTSTALLVASIGSLHMIRAADIVALPNAVFSYLFGLVKSLTANRSFVHTVHHARQTPAS